MKLQPLAWGAKVSPEFRGKARRIAQEIGADPSAFMAAMAFETGGTFDPAVRNSQSGATGLIQFMPKTAIGLGTTVDELAKMTAVDQLDWVKKYFVKNGYTGCIGTLPDLYMAILWPAAIGKPSDYILIRDDGGKAYIQNRGLDLNRDGNITKLEAADQVRKRLATGLLPQNITTYDESITAKETTEMEPSTVTGVTGLLSLLHPAAGILFQAFQPIIKEQIAAAVDKHSDTPGAGEALANSLSEALLGSAQKETGKKDELEAVAIARQNPAMVEKAQTAASDALAERLKQLAPLLDRIEGSIETDKAKWAAELESKKATSAIAIAEHTAGLWDMTPVLVYGGALMLMALVFSLIGALVFQAVTGDREIDSGLLGIAGPILMAAVTAWLAMINYRFDGSKQSSDQTKAVIGMTARNLEREE
jgi:hypothetical protein